MIAFTIRLCLLSLSQGYQWGEVERKQEAADWEKALFQQLDALPADVRCRVERIAVSGTSGSMLLVDGEGCGEPAAGRGSLRMYDFSVTKQAAGTSGEEAMAMLNAHTPAAHTVRSATSAPAKVLYRRQKTAPSLIKAVSRRSSTPASLSSETTGSTKRMPLGAASNALAAFGSSRRLARSSSKSRQSACLWLKMYVAGKHVPVCTPSKPKERLNRWIKTHARACMQVQQWDTAIAPLMFLRGIRSFDDGSLYGKRFL